MFTTSSQVTSNSIRTGLFGNALAAKSRHQADENARCETVAAIPMHLAPTAITAGNVNFWSYTPKFGKATHSQRLKVAI